ncbi:MAG: cobalamin-binding protein [Acidimicrobiia bacterium]|nr:MAG: cobalamin-binding protein [Acidimicrobiia bacterium]
MDRPELSLAITTAAVAGDNGTLFRLCRDLLDIGTPLDVLLFDHLLRVEREVGGRWAHGDYLVAEEHAATATVETVIGLFAGSLDQPPEAPLVVVTTAEGDQHSLPARAAATYLSFVGYRTNYLGPSVPAVDLRSFLQIEPPLAVVVSATMTTHLLGARAVIGAAHEVGVPVVAGGRGFGPEGRWSEPVGADAWVDDPRRIPDVLAGWAEQVPELREPWPIPDELAALRAARQRVLGKAEIDLGIEDPSDRLVDELALLLSALESTLLVGDDRILENMLSWQEATLRAHGQDPSRVVRALVAGLEDWVPEVGSRVTRIARRFFS